MIEEIIKNLEKGKYLLDFIEDDVYTNKTIAPYYSSIGGHVRHVLDMFACVFKGIDSKSIDLTKRERDFNVENYTVYGVEYFNTVINQLKSIQVSELSTIVEITDDLGGGVCVVNSTYAAILAQAHSHATHHFATVGYLMHALHICLPIDNFGINPTTPKRVKIS